jgi:hypothetical protein
MPETALMFRGFERLIIELFAGASLFLGWHLFSIGKVAKQTGEFAFKDWHISLQRVGPGIFFALFGASILIIGLFKPLEIHDASQSPTLLSNNSKNEQDEGRINMSYLGNNGMSLKSVQAINTVEEISKSFAYQIKPATDGELHAKAIKQLQAVRKQLMEEVFGKKIIEDWERHGEQYLIDPNNVPVDLRAKFNEIRPWTESIQ